MNASNLCRQVSPCKANKLQEQKLLKKKKKKIPNLCDPKKAVEGQDKFVSNEALLSKFAESV